MAVGAGHARRLDRIAAWWLRRDVVLYAIFAVACVAYTAAIFYGYLHVQTRGVWSAPLDDVFIHFDYARAFARGFPFQWSEGNGYSSGNTSWLYSMVLGLGYSIGFRELNLMLWAALIAGASVFALLIGAGTAVDEAQGEPGFTKYLVPPAVLSLGALDWTLFSGMENALQLGLWGLALSAAVRVGGARTWARALRRASWLGALGLLLVATRPESAVCVAAFGIHGAWCCRSWISAESGRPTRVKLGRVLAVLLASGGPALLLLTVQAICNRAWTGEWAQSGSIAKLIVYDPYASGSELWERYLTQVSYIGSRLIGHHFAASWIAGLLPVALAVVALLDRRLRALAVLVWVQIVGWLLLICLNSDIRWHNERYAMAPAAWLMLLAAIGLGALMRPGASEGARRSFWPRVGAAAGLAALFAWQQAPRMRDQIWFFGRASRNILDQHVTTGMLLKGMDVRRVLVGDAGAITYVSNRPGLDLMGLGGFHDYPFARAGRHGLGALIELIEQIPEDQRPDVMAIYPDWWGDLPTFFGRYLVAVPVEGNVICGGPEKVLYRARWGPLDRSGRPRLLNQGERIVDELDIADLASERQHDYRFPGPGPGGRVDFRVLADPIGQRDLFDAGRIIPAGERERAIMLAPGAAARLVVRIAPAEELAVDVYADGTRIGELRAALGAGWQEVDVELPAELRGRFELELVPQRIASTHYHVWVIQR